ncbi:MAG: hypothetical protein GXO61_01945 [Epsilonproteobacteria bacterium]|nr:hypothetical protein [Campylobacterota bacterium]
MQKEKFKSIVTINPYNNTTFLCENSVLKKFPSLKFYNKNFYISFLQTKDVIVATISVSKNIPEEDLRDVLELRVYEELDLDQTIEYKIEFEEIPTPSHEKERKFQVFVTEPTLITDTFEHIIQKVHYIDAIIPAPLLFKPLYTQKIIESDETHLFLYFQKTDTFLSIYHSGTLLYSKSLKYSFTDIAEKLSELKGENVEVEEVMKTLSQEGLKIADLDTMHYYMQIFSEIFMYLNDIIIYAKRVNNLEIIDKIFISSEIGFIRGIEEYAQTYLAQEAFDFNFNYGIDAQEPYIEDLHFLMVLCAKDIIEYGYPYANLTLFKRLPPLFKRPSGELLILSLVSLILALAYPIYNFLYAYKLKYDSAILHQQYPAIHAKRVALETQINDLKKRMEELKKKIELKKKELDTRQSILNAIYDKKVNYVMKGVTLAQLSQDMVDHKLKTTSIDNNQTLFNFKVTALDEKSITQFIKFISEHRDDRYDISTKEINRTDPNSTVYTSTLEVEVR